MFTFCKEWLRNREGNKHFKRMWTFWCPLRLNARFTCSCPGHYHTRASLVSVSSVLTCKGCLRSAVSSKIVHFIVVCLVAKPLNRSKAKVDLAMIQTLLLFKCILLYYYFMLTRYWSLSKQGHLQPHSKSKTWQLSTQLKNGLLLKSES